MTDRREERRVCNRREFLRLGGLGAGAALWGGGLGGCQRPARRSGPAVWQSQPISRPIRVGVVGVGARGQHLMRILLDFPDEVAVTAICDTVPERTGRAQELVAKGAGANTPEEQRRPRRTPTGYTGGQWDFVRMCETESLDLVVNATPTRWHLPVTEAALRTGSHVALENPPVERLDECWALVEAVEKHRRHCIPLVNTTYFRNLMMVLNMVRQGLLGELTHCAGGYERDYRLVMFDQDGLIFRGEEHLKHNGNLYPTAAVAPLAQYAGVNRGDRFDYLVSLSSKSRGMNEKAMEYYGPEHPLATREFAQGDVNVTLLRTVNGVSMMLYFMGQSYMPYEMPWRVQGTQGVFEGRTVGESRMENRIHVNGRTTWQNGDQWEHIDMAAPTDAYTQEYEHPLWQALGSRAAHYSYGGADYIQMYRLVTSLREATEPDMDVYDAATWSVLRGLTEKSVARGSVPVSVPDFTRGAWKRRPPLGIVGA